MKLFPQFLRRVCTVELLALLALGSFASGLQAGLANVWHIPDNSTDLGGTHMRDPWIEISNNSASPTTVTIYQGIQKWTNSGATQIANQTGGTLFYKGASQGSWQSVPLGYSSGTVNNQYWKASFSTSGIAANDPIQYYIYVTTDNFNGVSSAYLYAPSGTGDGGGAVTGDPAVAAASPYSVRNRPGWIFHANNRVISGSEVDFWAKLGYIGDANNTATEWATNGAVYYTTDGSAPGGSLGTGTGTTQVAAFTYDHPESNSQSAPSIAGTAMWWAARVPALLQNMPIGGTIKYKVGFWNTANNEEKFGDYNAGASNQVFLFTNGTIGAPVLTVYTPANGTLNGDYTTSHLFVDEIAGDSIPVLVTFQPNQSNVDPASVQVFTNLNRREKATLTYTDANGILTEEGINPPNGSVVGTDDSHYYKAYTMSSAGAGVYSLTLPAQKTGAYRLTARYQKTTDSNPRPWYYYTTSGRRDHCIVVSPVQSRNINLYELNTLTVNATGDQPDQRGSFSDLWDHGKTARASGAGIVDLNYVKNLGCNWLWFQPIHPDGIDGRETDSSTGQPYTIGSPYSVKNFFEVMPLMSSAFAGTNSASSNDTAAGRVSARQDFHDFLVAADTAGVGVMLDAPFNHSSFDAEIAPASAPSTIANLNNLISPGSNPTDQIRNKEARFYSLSGNYAQRASSAGVIANAPDRGDFGKWADVHDIYFGTYSALVDVNPGDNGNYLNESDQFLGYLGSSSYPNGDPNWNSVDFTSNSVNNNVTRNVWKYFAQYVPYWLSQTGHVDGGGNLVGNSSNSDPVQRLVEDSRGIDGLRADFGQGLPPQCWEYIINVARSYKWNFVFMTESLDGGAVTYRSNRHFDILNENIIFPFQNATQTSDYRSVFEQRRSAYGQSLVLLNNMSHDEQAYGDPFLALIRYGVSNAIDGAPMIFYGQENGISTTYGFHHYETNFGKSVAHFKEYNDLGQILGNQTYGLRQLYPVYAGMGQARQFSRALRSSNRYYLDQTGGGGVQQSLFSVAKYETPNAQPAFGDVVFAFMSLDKTGTQSGNFNVNITQNGSNLFGIQAERTYNVKNIAAYTGIDGNRRNHWLWSSPGRSGGNVLASGIFVSMNPVPVTDGAWATAPMEAQYLKLYDVSAPATPAPQTPRPYAYSTGTTATFTWAPDPNVNPVYTVTVVVNGGAPTTVTSNSNSYTYTGSYGDKVSVTVQATNPDYSPAQSGTSSPTVAVKLLDPNGDEDGDGMSNAAEDAAGTNPLNAQSVFRVTSVTQSSGSATVFWSSVAGKTYVVQSTASLSSPGSWTDIAGSGTAGTGGVVSYTDNAAAGTGKFYRVRLGP
jgi:hypothetical protein